MHLFLIAACAGLALIAASCSVVQPKPLPGPTSTPGAAPQAGVVHINLVPEVGGMRARYALPGLAKVYAFRDNASDIRTDTWSTPTAGAKLERNHIALGDGLRVFEIDLKPDTQQRDRIYPSLSQIGEGWLIYAPQFLPPVESGQPADISFSLPEGWVVLAPTDEGGDIELNGWLFVGPPALIESGAANVAIAPATPAWLRKEILDAANSAAAFFEKRLEIKLEAKPGIVISVYPEDSSNSVRGDVTPGAMMSVRFYGEAWTGYDPGAAEQVRELLAHEFFHFWNGGIASSADDAEKPWLHEGGASYAAMLALSPGAKPSDAAFMGKLNDNLVKCQTALEETESLKTAMNLQFGNAPYACGVVLQWAWDAGLRSSSGNERDVLSLWKDMLADARGNGGRYSLDSAVRLTPGPASRAANLLLDQSGAARWDDFAEAMRGYGAQLTRQRNGDEDRNTALMHVLATHCDGQYGFYNFDTYLRLDTGNRCGTLDGDKEFDTVAGVSVTGDGAALHDRVRAACAAGGSVDFSRNGVVIASATCAKPLTPAKERWTVTRAFSA
jgi:hypothetical protein